MGAVRMRGVSNDRAFYDIIRAASFEVVLMQPPRKEV